MLSKNQKTPIIQRLGFLLDELEAESLAGSLLQLLDNKPKEFPLSLAHKTKSGPTNKKWNIIINSELDF